MHMQSKLILTASAVALSWGLGAGFLLGQATAPVAVDSELATAQVLAQDRNVRWVAYGCGMDSATLVTREMPDLTECKDIRLLSESAEFSAPPPRLN